MATSTDPSSAGLPNEKESFLAGINSKKVVSMKLAFYIFSGNNILYRSGV